jgi:hypothetical protein
LQSLLISLTRTRAFQQKPADVLRRWESDRFVRPASVDPRALTTIEATLWGALPDDFQPIELSPLAPLGTSSVVAGVSQNRVVSTARTSEVVSDTTNVLALECASRRGAAGFAVPVHLAATQRQVRAQQFGAGARAHFKLFCLVSSDRAGSSATTESRLLRAHINFWRAVLDELIPHLEPKISLTPLDESAEWIEEDVRQLGHDAHSVEIALDRERTHGAHYYERASLSITARDPNSDEEWDLGDGGFVNWTARLTENAKERCLVSCISTERLAQLRR